MYVCMYVCIHLKSVHMMAFRDLRQYKIAHSWNDRIKRDIRADTRHIHKIHKKVKV